MRYIVSAHTVCRVEFESVEIEADDEDELNDKIFDELVESLANVDFVVSKETLEDEDEE
jgi:hypothetical protein